MDRETPYLEGSYLAMTPFNLFYKLWLGDPGGAKQFILPKLNLTQRQVLCSFRDALLSCLHRSDIGTNRLLWDRQVELAQAVGRKCPTVLGVNGML